MRRLVLAGMTAAALVAGAQAMQAMAESSAASATAGKVDSKAVVAEVRRIIAANYVLPEVRPRLDASLAAGLAAGRYDTSDPGVLVDRINADMSAVAHDKHLSLRYAPQDAALIGTRQDDRQQDGPAFARFAQMGNHGITEMRLLPGNVRYVAIDGFAWTGPKSAEAIDVAMRFLRDGDAAIIDLRHNGGGSPEAVRYAISHFLEPNKPIVTFYMGADHVDRLSTLADLPAGRMIGKPLYVLVSGMTASAAEEFTGHVKGFRIGELIGANTAGAGFRNDNFSVSGGFVLSVSVGRAVLASTGSDWEGRGFAPDTAVDPEKALDFAQLHAMRKLAETAIPAERKLYAERATLLGAQLEPPATALPLAAYAGRFGERVISLDQGQLMFQRDGGAKIELTALGANLFTLGADPGSRIQFAVAGDKVTGFEMVRGDGSKVEAERSQ